MNKKNGKGNFLKVLILVVALIVLAVSGTYAYYTTAITGTPTKTEIKSGVFKVDTSLESVSAILNTKMKLIDSANKGTQAEKLTFTVKSPSDATVDGNYYIYLKDIHLSKNLYTKYLKWELEKDGTVVASGDFSSATRSDSVTSGEADNVVTTVNNIQLNTNPIRLAKKESHTLVYRMWLENDPNVNQISITNGSFSGRLYLEAFPVSSVTNNEVRPS